VPIAKLGRKATPFAAVFGHKQNCVDYSEVLKFYIPALNRQAVPDLFELLLGDLYWFQL
jgi:hypothetical protein